MVGCINSLSGNAYSRALDYTSDKASTPTWGVPVHIQENNGQCVFFCRYKKIPTGSAEPDPRSAPLLRVQTSQHGGPQVCPIASVPIVAGGKKQTLLCQLCTTPHIFHSDFCLAGPSVSAPGELLQNVYLTLLQRCRPLFSYRVPRPCRDAFVVTTTHGITLPRGFPLSTDWGFPGDQCLNAHRRYRLMSVLNVARYTAPSAGTPA